MEHNKEQIKTRVDYHSRQKVMANQLQNVEYQRDKQVNLLLSKIDVQEEAIRKTNRTMSEKVKKLQVALEDRMSTMNSMASKLSIAEADLALAEQKCSDLEHALQKAQLDKENELKFLTAKSKHDKEVPAHVFFWLRFKLIKKFKRISPKLRNTSMISSS